MKIVKKIICLYTCLFRDKRQKVKILELDKGIFRKMIKDDGCFLPLHKILQQSSIYPCRG